jgi:hypothetical protein
MENRVRTKKRAGANDYPAVGESDSLARSASSIVHEMLV